MTLFLITQSYPYSYAAEDTFIDPEIPILLEYFDDVIIIPAIKNGTRRDLPEKVEVETSFADYIKSGECLLRTFVSMFFCSHLYTETLKYPRKILGVKQMYELVTHLYVAIAMRDWIEKYIDKKRIDLSQTVFYTYWCYRTTTGLAMLRKRSKELRLVSRIHGYDLYDFRHAGHYIAFRDLTFGMTEAIYADSQLGFEYLRDNYPEWESHFHTSIMGVSPKAQRSKTSNDGIFRFVSCSAVLEVKRVGLIFDGLSKLANNNPQKKYEWFHFGAGELFEELKNKVKQAPHNLTCHLPGNISNDKVMNFYESSPVDLFVHMSSSEGGCVAIQEAQSYAVPVIAAGNGGVLAIVSNENGRLLPSTPTPQEISEAIASIIDDSACLLLKKNKSFEMWERHNNAEKNYNDFASQISNLLKSKHE
jgi:glycosyltransferase involved in cell wall biosynthesis